MTESGKECSVQERWTALKNTVINSAEKVIGYRKRAAACKPWVTADMIDKMEERRKWKNIPTEEGGRRYKRLNNELRGETEKAKEEWWEGECEQLEDMDRRGRADQMYAKVKHLTKSSTSGSRCVSINDSNGKLLTEPSEIQANQSINQCPISLTL